MSRDEIEWLLAPLRERAQDHAGQSLLADVECLVAHDDGREFVLHNVIRYRKKALYPPGYDYGDSATDADRRYHKAVAPYLLRYGNMPVFVARGRTASRSTSGRRSRTRRYFPCNRS